MRDPVWRPVPGFPGYEAGDHGEIRSCERKCRTRDGERLVSARVLKPDLNRPYGSVTLFRDGERHRHTVPYLVAVTFIGPRPMGMEVCHNDGTRTNHRADNLRWDTRVGNFADKVRHGTDARGHKHGMAKLSEAQVVEIRAQRGARTQAQLAEQFGVARSLVSMIQARRVWRHVA